MPPVKTMVCEGLFGSIGLELDKEKNDTLKEGNRSLESEKSKIRLLVIPTNEELEIALQTQTLLLPVKD